MCGIVGYIGPREAAPILLEGLARLEYRGYDSAGIALVTNNGEMFVEKRAGKLANLRTALVDGTPSAVLVNEEGVVVSEIALGAEQIWKLVGKK